MLHTAGRLGYEELEDFVIALSEVIEPEEKIQEWVEELYLLKKCPSQRNQILEQKIASLERFVEEIESQYIKIQI